MTDGKDQGAGYIVGRGRPPLHSRFKEGVCANPKGRGKAKLIDIGQSLGKLVGERISIKIGGKKKTVTRQEAQIWGCVHEAMGGNLAAAETVVDLLTLKEKKRRPRGFNVRHETEVKRDIALGILPKNTIIRRDFLEKFNGKKTD